MKFVLVKILLPLLVLVVGVAAAGYLVKTRPQAPKAERKTPPTIVTWETAEVASEPVTVSAIGRVGPARVVTLMAEVSGRVKSQASGLVQGGLLVEGEVAVKLEDEDYVLAVRQQEAQVAVARFELELEAGRRTVAEQEWEKLEREVQSTADGKALALRKPHLKVAQAQLSAARSGLKRARLMVDKTNVLAPFNAFVKANNSEPGMLAAPGAVLATLIGTDAFWVEATLPVAHLAWFDVPGVNGFDGAEGALVKLIQDVGDGVQLTRHGRVIRLLGELDPLGVQARVIVRIDDPLLLEPDAATSEELPLLLGSFVRLAIEGLPLPDAVRIPNVAVHDETQVWVMTSEGVLSVREVEIAWQDDHHALLVSGVEAGERVVTSRISAPVDGMPLTAIAPKVGAVEPPTVRVKSVAEGVGEVERVTP